MRRGCVYFNSSILVRAINPREGGHSESLRFVDELFSEGFTLVYSSIHELEGFSAGTLSNLLALFREYHFVKCRVNASRILVKADEHVRIRGYSRSRRFDIAHLLAARECGCGFIAAVDKFIWRHAGEFGLKYINYYVGIP